MQCESNLTYTGTERSTGAAKATSYLKRIENAEWRKPPLRAGAVKATSSLAMLSVEIGTSLPRSFVILLCESMKHLLPAFVMP